MRGEGRPEERPPPPSPGGGSAASAGPGAGNSAVSAGSPGEAARWEKTWGGRGGLDAAGEARRPGAAGRQDDGGF